MQLPVAEPIGSRASQPATNWIWVPTLYFAESVPNAVVSDTANFLYNDLGVSPEQLGVITGSIYLPWVLKPLWSPMVDLLKTKRWWIVLTQLMLAGCFFLLSVSLHFPHWLICSAACLWVMAFTSATHDIAADGFYMLGLNEVDQARLTGIRSTAYRLAMMCAKGFMVWAAGYLTFRLGKTSGWSTVLMVPALAFVGFALFHYFTLPRPDSDRSVGGENFWKGYADTFTSYFAKPGIPSAVAFMLLFRLAEAQLLAMVAPFLTKPRIEGGLELATKEVGVAYGTFGVAGIILGGILAGWLVSQQGLRRMYWPMIFIMHVPNAAFLYLAFAQPSSTALIRSTLFVEQFGYGFGFTAYILYLMYFSRGPLKTSHYAICTGFMALSIMLPKMVSGYVLKALGFKLFFVYIVACTLPSFVVSLLAWRDRDFIDYYPPEQK